MLARGSEYGMADADAQARITAWTSSSTGGFATYSASAASPSTARRPAGPPAGWAAEARGIVTRWRPPATNARR